MARRFGIMPAAWDEMPIEERVRLLAAARDQGDMDYIQSLPKEERDKLADAASWTVLAEQ